MKKKNKRPKTHQRPRNAKASGAAFAEKGKGHRREMRDGNLNYGKSKERAANPTEYFGN